MRTTKELLQLTINFLEKEEDIPGICYALDIMVSRRIIERNEYLYIKDLLEKNFPKRTHSWKYDWDYNIIRVKSEEISFYWKPFNIKPRIDFLNKLITKLG